MRTATEFRKRWEAQRASGLVISFIEGHLISENAKHALEDAMGTPDELKHCRHWSRTLPVRPRGLWQQALLDKAAELWAKDPTQQEIFLYEQIKTGTIFAYDYFGSAFSAAREEAIKNMLVNGIGVSFQDNDARFATLFATFDDTMIEWLSGSAIIVIRHADGVDELPREIDAGETINFDASDTLIIRNDLTSDSSDDPFRLIIPKLYKATITAVGDSRSEITDSADGTYTYPAADYNAAFTKVRPYTHTEVVFRNE